MSARSKSGEAEVPPRVSVILDDMRWEEKLKVARERRAAVLAQKAADSEAQARADMSSSPPDAWAEAVAAPLAMDADEAPVARPVVTPIAPPVAEPAITVLPVPEPKRRNNRKRVAALAASVAVAAILAGGALTNGDPSLEGGFVSLFRTTDGAVAPEIKVASLGLSAVPVEVDEPDMPVAGAGSAVPERLSDYAAVAVPDGPTLLPEPVVAPEREPVLVASLAPRAAEIAGPVAAVEPPVSVNDPTGISSESASALPAAQPGSSPSLALSNPVPNVQETVLAFAVEAGETTSVPPLSEVRAVDALPAPQVLESQGEAEAGWTPTAGLGVALPIRLSVFAPSALEADPVAALVASVEAGANTDSVLSPVDFKVSATHVRYYREEDLPAAKQVAALAGGTVRDFTGYAPQPAKGTVELWLAGVPEPQAEGGDTILASLEPARSQVNTPVATAAIVPTPTAVPTVATPVTTAPKVTQRRGFLNSIFGRNGFYKNPRPAAAAAAPPPKPAPTIGKFKNSVLGTLNGGGISNATRLNNHTPALSAPAASSTNTASTASATAARAGGNRLKAGKIKQAKAAAAAAKSKAKSKPKAGPGRWK